MSTYHIPEEAEFPEGQDFIAADKDLIDTYFALIDASPELGHLKSYEVGILWQKKGSKKGGKAVYGNCRKPSGLLLHYSRCAFIVCLAADHCRDWQPTPIQLEALLYHELLHAGENEKGTPIVLDHDFQGFNMEIESYGDWHTGLSGANRSFQKAPARPTLRAVPPITMKRQAAV